MKTTENSEPLDRQARLGIEPATSRLPVLSAEPLHHWWSDSWPSERENNFIYIHIVQVFISKFNVNSTKMICFLLFFHWTLISMRYDLVSTWICKKPYLTYSVKDDIWHTESKKVEENFFAYTISHKVNSFEIIWTLPCLKFLFFFFKISYRWAGW